MTQQPRVRRSIRQLEQLENKNELDNLIRAFRGIQALPADDYHSFFTIAGYHGEPFVVKGKDVAWGGYCFHGSVLFPTWHRAYCLRIENALRSIPGCENVTLPYWDEYAEVGSQVPVPAILTSPTYVLDNETIPNPLYSYQLQKTLVDDEDHEDLYTKHAGYSTVRFPLSGLVGTEKARNETKVWNTKAKWATPEAQANELNANIRNWLVGEVDIDPNAGAGRLADTYSTIARIRKCMLAPNWTVFSNKASAAEYASKRGHDNVKEHWVVALEEPHNAIHLALGGMFQKATSPKDPGYNADPRNYEGANGDMGENETAAFDPIFFIHHCFIDYAMWSWQKKHNRMKRGSLEIDHSIKAGTVMDGGNAALPNGTKMTMTSPLKPFTKPNREPGPDDAYYTSDDVTDIDELGYSYEPGSFDVVWHSDGAEETTPPLLTVKKTASVDRSKYPGSFVIRTYATVDGKKVEIGRDPILSRYNVSNCQNCQNVLEATAFVPIHKDLAEALDPEGTRKIPYTVEIQHLRGQEEYRPGKSDSGGHWDSVEQFIEY